MLNRVTIHMTIRIDEKNESFAVRTGSYIPRAIFAVEQRQAKVITNLLSNTVKFTPEGGRIELSVQNIADSGRVCRL